MTTLLQPNTTIKFALTALLVCLALGLLGGKVSSAKVLNAQECDVNPDQPAQRVFADPDGKHGWREYGSVKHLPELENDAGELALLWVRGDRKILVSTQEPGQDFAAYTDYRFDSKGRLIHLRFELRTAWGWGYREKGVIREGRLVPDRSEFFNLETGAHISKPAQAGDVPDALKPELYVRESELPFFKLVR